MKINPGTAGLAQNMTSRVGTFSKSGKVVKMVRMSGCEHNEY